MRHSLVDGSLASNCQFYTLCSTLFFALAFAVTCYTFEVDKTVIDQSQLYYIFSSSPAEADLRIGELQWGDSGVYYCKVIIADDLEGKNEGQVELLVLGMCVCIYSVPDYDWLASIFL